MPTLPSRWHVPGSLGVNTSFDESTDQPTPLSVSWATVGSVIRHTGGETLNLLEAGDGAVDRGPGVNWWALNARVAPDVAPKAVRLASMNACFSATGEGKAAGYLSLSTKSSSG